MQSLVRRLAALPVAALPVAAFLAAALPSVAWNDLARAEEERPPADRFFGQPLRFWLNELESADPLAREEAIRVLERVGPAAQQAAPRLRALLADKHLETRFHVALALWSVLGRGDESLPTLQADFAQLTPAARDELMAFCQAASPADESLIRVLLLLAADPARGQGVFQVLRGLGEESLPLFTKLLEANPGAERATLIGVAPFGFVDRASGELLAKYLADADGETRLLAAARLVYVRARRDEAVAVLVELADSEKPALVLRALNALATLRPVPRAAEKVLARATREGDLARRLGLAPAYLELRPEAAAEFAALCEEAMRGGNPEAANAATMLAPRLGSHGANLTAPLIARLKGARGSFAVVVSCLRALEPNAPAAAKAVEGLLFDDATGAQGQLNSRLNFRVYGPHMVEEFRRRLTGDNAALQKVALQAMLTFPPETIRELLPAITPVLKLKDDKAVEAALAVLERAGPAAREAAPELLAVLDREDGARWLDFVGRAARAARPEARHARPLLMKLGEKPALSPGERLLAFDLALPLDPSGDEAVRWLSPGLAELRVFDLRDALERLGPRGVKLAPALRKVLEQRPGDIQILGDVVARMGPSAAELAPPLLDQVATTRDVSRLLAIAEVAYALAPDRRGEVDARLNEVLLERFAVDSQSGGRAYPMGPLAEFGTRSPGPTEALAPLLVKTLREDKALDIQVRAKIALMLARLGGAHEAESLRFFEAELGLYPHCPAGVLIGLLRARPDHPRALANLKRFLESGYVYHQGGGVEMAAQCPPNLPGVRPLVENALADLTDPRHRAAAYVALMRYDNRLREDYVAEIFAAAEQSGSLSILEPLRYLGPLGKPLAPRLRAARADMFSDRWMPAVIAELERE